MIKIDEINYMERDAYGWTLVFHTKNDNFGKVKKLRTGEEKVGTNEYSDQRTYHANYKQCLEEYSDRMLGLVEGTNADAIDKINELLETIKNLPEIK